MKKKILATAMILALCLGFAACGNANKTKMETDTITIDGVYIDSSYQEEKGQSLVYLFYTIHSPQENMQHASSSMSMMVNDANTYDAKMVKDFMPIYTNYCYSEFLKDIYVGDSYQMCSAFEVANGDLADSKTISLKDSRISDIDAISFTTDDIKTMADAEAIAEDLDAEVYAERYQAEKEKMSAADKTTTAKVRRSINNYEWELYATLGTSLSKYTLGFSSPNKFYISNSLGMSNSGIYKVKKGVVELDYQNDGYRPALEYYFDASGNFQFADSVSSVFSTYVDYDPLGEE